MNASFPAAKEKPQKPEKETFTINIRWDNKYKVIKTFIRTVKAYTEGVKMKPHKIGKDSYIIITEVDHYGKFYEIGIMAANVLTYYKNNPA